MDYFWITSHLSGLPVHSNDLSQQSTRLVQHKHRHSNILRILHDHGHPGLGDSLQGMAEDGEPGHRRRRIRISRHDRGHFSTQHFQGEPTADKAELQQYLVVMMDHLVSLSMFLARFADVFADLLNSW